MPQDKHPLLAIGPLGVCLGGLGVQEVRGSGRGGLGGGGLHASKEAHWLITGSPNLPLPSSNHNLCTLTQIKTENWDQERGGGGLNIR